MELTHEPVENSGGICVRGTGSTTPHLGVLIKLVCHPPPKGPPRTATQLMSFASIAATTFKRSLAVPAPRLRLYPFIHQIARMTTVPSLKLSSGAVSLTLQVEKPVHTTATNGIHQTNTRTTPRLL